MTSRESATTQIVLLSLLTLRQISQTGSADRWKQTEHKPTCFFASTKACARASTSASGRFKMCKASLWAVLGPTPGRRCSCSINRAKGRV